MNINDKLRELINDSTRSLMAATVFGCCLITASPMVEAQSSAAAPVANSNAAFVAWHQGFERNTEGWYDASTEGALGWCGAIDTVSRRDPGGEVPSPSAGNGYATIKTDLCNEFWSERGVPFGATYAPGPEQVLYSSAWPKSGYVTELDIWLDPAWSSEYFGNFGFPGSGSSADAIVQYAATIFPTAPDAEPFHTGPHYFVEVEALPEEQALMVAGERIENAGWYTFRYVFTDVAGHVNVDFELVERRGAVLAVIKNVAPVDLLGPVKLPFGQDLLTAEYGSGHVWFFDIAFGLDLPVDEHRVRRGH